MNTQNLLDNDNKIIIENAPLKNKWNYYFHKIKDNNWDLESYQLLYTFDNIRDYWKLYNNHPYHIIGLFFLMRDNIAPMWEDKENINGGTYSFKIQKNNIEKAWIEISSAVIGETLIKENEFVTGLSIHPKYNCFIIKIWVKCELTEAISNLKLDFFDPNMAIYKKNII